ncbi:MAG: lipopolysaccharide biosynthesis protein [Pirellulaceae bacterium]
MSSLTTDETIELSEPEGDEVKRHSKVTSLAEGMFLLAGLTVVQRGVGFVRGVLFCRWLSAHQLGQWDLAFGFLMLVGPLVVLGIPGSFGRYVEHYQQRGQLRLFLVRTSWVSLVLSLLGFGLLWTFDGTVARLLYNDPGEAPVVRLLGLTLMAVIGFNFQSELFVALRQIRVVSALHFVNSIGFAVLGLGLIYFWESSAHSVIAAYGLACIVTIVLGMFPLIDTWRYLPANQQIVPQASFWKKLLPFAMWLWAVNLLSNLFEVVDRYMIVHVSGLESVVAVSLVGDYHSSRVIPWLMVAVATLFGGVLLPHLTADWEQGRIDKVRRQLGLAFKLTCMITCAGGIAIATLSPMLFYYVFQGKYAGGLEVMPWTLTYCVWYCLTGLILLYFCCTEKNHRAALVYAIGLSTNIVLNAILLPPLGLPGAVMATAFAHATALALGLVMVRREGMNIPPQLLIFAIIPVCLAFSVPLMAAVWIVVLWQGLYGNWILSEQEKEMLVAGLQPLVKRLPAWATTNN